MTEAIEYISVAFNVAYILLAARGSIWCWPMGIVGSALGVVLFIESKFYAEAVLFLYYVAMGVYGWYAWKGKSEESGALDVVTWKMPRHFLMMGMGYVLTLVLAWFLMTYTDAEMPLLDSFTTIFAFIATWMVAKRVLENWIYWIAIDALTIYLYLSRDFELYALLSLVYTGIAFYGYAKWKRNYIQPDSLNGIDQSGRNRSGIDGKV